MRPLNMTATRFNRLFVAAPQQQEAVLLKNPH